MKEKFYLHEFKWFDGEEFITFNIVNFKPEKMEIEVAAPCAGTVKAISANVGSAVNTDDLLVTLG